MDATEGAVCAPDCEFQHWPAINELHHSCLLTVPFGDPVTVVDRNREAR